MKHTALTATITILLVVPLCTAINRCIPPRVNTTYRHESELRYEAAKVALIDSVNKYIMTVAPESCLDGIILVEACEKHNFDLKFALAQGHLESHFGTAGTAARTNSVFNLYAYDGVVNPRGYKDPNDSVEPYIHLIQKRYLGKSRVEADLFESFTTVEDGLRYASATDYEVKLFNIYSKIDNVCNISQALARYNKYKILANR